MKNNNILEILCKGPFLNFKKNGRIIIVKEIDKVGLVNIYELNKKIIKNYEPHPN